MSQIAVIGSGYVGTVIGSVLANQGNQVRMIDIDPRKIKLINMREPPIYELGLKELLREGDIEAGDKLDFTPDYLYICVGTPSNGNGSINTEHIKSACESVKDQIGGDTVVIVKSTILNHFDDICEWLGTDKVVMNPEFLREGDAIGDFLHPERIVLGGRNQEAMSRVRELYFSWPESVRTLETGPDEASLIKYGCNAFLPSDISLALVAEEILYERGVNYWDVLRNTENSQGRFLRPGSGWGGSCFPKDIRALINYCYLHGIEPELLEVTIQRNEIQVQRLISLMKEAYGDLPERVGLLGLAFKPGTDDTRDSPAIGIAHKLLGDGVEVYGYDKLAMDKFKREPGMERVRLLESPESVLEVSDAVIIVKDTDGYGSLNFPSGYYIVDADRGFEQIPRGLNYRGIGVPLEVDELRSREDLEHYGNLMDLKTLAFYSLIRDICDKRGLNYGDVVEGMKLDTRIPGEADYNRGMITALEHFDPDGVDNYLNSLRRNLQG